MGAEPSSRLEGNIPCGWLPLSHIESVLSTKNLELVAICDPDENKMKRFKQHYQIKNGYTNYEELIKVHKPTFITIATRTHVRKSIIDFAIKEGVKLIYAEKPLCNSLKEAVEIIKKLDDNHVKMCYGVNRRYHAIYRKAKWLVANGAIGELKEIYIENGLSNLFWTHPHSADMLIYFAGTTQIEAIQGLCKFNYEAKPSDLLIDDDPLIDHAFIKFNNGINGVITNTLGISVRLCGTKGNLAIHGDGKFLEYYTGEGYFYQHHRINESNSESATQNVMKEMCDGYLMSQSMPISHDEIYAGMCMLFGIVQSSLHSGSMIKPAEINTDRIITGKAGAFYA